MIQSEYLAELRRRRAITTSFTWKIALPFWKGEMWMRDVTKAASELHARTGSPSPIPEDERGSKTRMELCLIRAIVPFIALSRVLRRSSHTKSKFDGRPARTEEVYADIQFGRTHAGAAPSRKA